MSTFHTKSMSFKGLVCTVLLFLTHSCVNAQFGELLGEDGLVCYPAKCAELECCGPQTSWERPICREDLESIGFVGDYPDDFEKDSCKIRACAEASCCGYGTVYDELLGLCVLVGFATQAPSFSPAPSPSLTPGPTAKKEVELCVFKGFEDPRYQEHDRIICDCVKKLNADKMGFTDGTAAQAAMVANLDPNLVKCWLIQETGGNDKVSLPAWAKDPAQVNVPGDWNEFKPDVGLKEPKVRNEGTLKGNLEAALKYLVRKGFGRSGQPTKNRPEGTFDGWDTALLRYNGRNNITTTNGKSYSRNYVDRINARCDDKTTHYPIELPKPV
jgi:hypothetical protein